MQWLGTSDAQKSFDWLLYCELHFFLLAGADREIQEGVEVFREYLDSVALFFFCGEGKSIAAFWQKAQRNEIGFL